MQPNYIINNAKLFAQFENEKRNDRAEWTGTTLSQSSSLLTAGEVLTAFVACTNTVVLSLLCVRSEKDVSV